MKLNIRTIALTLSTLFAIGFLPSLHAQSLHNAQVAVPFSFDFGSTHFSAGTYFIKTVRPNIMVLRGPSKQVSMAMIRSEHVNRFIETAQVAFEKYGDRYFLKEVRVQSSSTSLVVCQSKAERQAARDLTAHRTAPARVEEALLIAPHPSTQN